MDGHSFNASIARTESEGTSSFMMLKEYGFRELYLGLKVTASFDHSEHTRVIDGQARCITLKVKPQNLQVIWNSLSQFSCRHG